MANDYIQRVEKPFLQNYAVGATVDIPNVANTVVKDDNLPEAGMRYSYQEAGITVTFNGHTETISTNEYGSGQIKLEESGTYVIRYFGVIRYSYSGADGGAHLDSNFSVSFYIAAVENKLPLKKQTITDVLNRLLDVCEPIHKDEKPRFRLQGMSADGQIVGGQARCSIKLLRHSLRLQSSICMSACRKLEKLFTANRA